MNRRDGIIARGALSLGIGSSHAFAQAKQRNLRAWVAILEDAPAATRAHLWASFRKRLKDLGYADDVVLEQRWAGGNVDKLPELAADLVTLKPDVIVAVTTTAALAVKKRLPAYRSWPWVRPIRSSPVS